MAGLQVPVKPLVEELGKTGAVALAQIAGIALKVGMIFGLTTTVILVVLVAHCPVVGVNVYVVVAVLFIAGDQVPVTPFDEVVGKFAKVSPEQIVKIAGMKEAVSGFIFILIVLPVAHCPILGEKV